VRSLPGWARKARARWRYTGRERPDFAVAPAPGQESVWDYPRPPRVVGETRELGVSAHRQAIAHSSRGVRVLETASPPTFYLPPEDIRLDLLESVAGSSRCEWKGEAQYWTLVLEGRRIERVAWSYADPFPGFETIRGWLAFYPGRIECSVDGVRVEPQPGGLYGGWVTAELVGPWKGIAGSEAW
jgi:uncharacterized protein (DUF427 family)